MSVYVYYCSGHGYGHATRVSAFTCHLHSLREDEGRPTVNIVSSAPEHVFSEAISAGAVYRYADWIDPVIVQPLAYRVDREKSVQVLEAFLSKKSGFLETERRWLSEVGAKCVLSDAAFLGCMAAKLAGVPSILITNFTFDSVYSFLSTSLVDDPDSSDTPISPSDLSPLVSQIHEGYKHADLLILLPGNIPIPSFFSDPRVALPSHEWVDPQTRRFKKDVTQHLEVLERVSLNDAGPDLSTSPSLELHPRIPFPAHTPLGASQKQIKRRVICAPLIVRPPSGPPSAPSETLKSNSALAPVHLSPYTQAGRSQILTSIGVPPHLHEINKTKILVVSFGGQVFRCPNPPKPTRAPTPTSKTSEVAGLGLGLGLEFTTPAFGIGGGVEHARLSPTQETIPTENGSRLTQKQAPTPLQLEDHRKIDPRPVLGSPRLTTPTIQILNSLDGKLDGMNGFSSSSAQYMNIWIPGAPGPSLSPMLGTVTAEGDVFGQEVVGHRTTDVGIGIKEYDHHYDGFIQEEEHEQASRPEILGPPLEDLPQLLPDDSWIAIVCGVSKEQWERSKTEASNGSGNEGGEEKDGLGLDLPPNFFIVPPPSSESQTQVHFPSLLALSDCLLGKLGYGSVSECIDSQTPFVFVSRPLFVEEWGLRRVLEDVVDEEKDEKDEKDKVRKGRWMERTVGIEMSREEYEGGRWAARIMEAVGRRETNKTNKTVKRMEEGTGRDLDTGTGTEIEVGPSAAIGTVGIRKREKEGRELALKIVEWVRECWEGVDV
ncbi:hypothetical protein D9758_003889 [Tetrapyrgos nigripes]|uniref:L-arabinokinase n=1 Tax=Tetrapyrgos nigripes TaxID=182062 RepID=A0A8H5GL18_9AGAR|nr:hypothetical protein D9758_003889 [Tetrapyrgos nigripes]